MPLPLTKSQIERLGRRLVEADEPAESDIASLHEVLRAYALALEAGAQRLRDATGLRPTSRIKNTGTIIEKLRRHGGSWLKSIQDLAGMRVVGPFDRRGQDELVGDVVCLFNDAPRSPKVIDRRARPVNGYRAVHVVVFPESMPIEIQIRTELQHEWAEVFEKIADLVGRDIRYGEPPTHWLSLAQRDALDAETLELYDLLYAASGGLVEAALTVADAIATFEEAEHVRPDAPQLAQFREGVASGLAALRALAEKFESFDVRAMWHIGSDG